MTKLDKAKFDVKALREKVLATDDIKYDEVHVAEWDVTLPVKTLSASEMKEVMKYQKDTVRMTIIAMLYGCKTQDGEVVFSKEDLAVFESQKAFNPIMTVSEKILEMSGFGGESFAQAKND